MSTLSALLHSHDAPALLLPPSATGHADRTDIISHSRLSGAIDEFRKSLAGLGLLEAQDVVSMSLINSAEFVVAFIAAGMHRCVIANVRLSTTDEVKFADASLLLSIQRTMPLKSRSISTMRNQSCF